MKVDGGIGFELDKAGAQAQELEAMGYSGILTAETSHDPFFPLLVAAQHTQKIELMTSIAVACARTPMVLANIGHDLNAASKGRFILGLGSQIKPHITKRFSMPWSNPAPRMREFILAMRAIWASWHHGDLLTPRIAQVPLGDAAIRPPLLLVTQQVGGQARKHVPRRLVGGKDGHEPRHDVRLVHEARRQFVDVTEVRAILLGGVRDAGATVEHQRLAPRLLEGDDGLIQHRVLGLGLAALVAPHHAAADRQHQRCEHGDDADHHQQLDQGKGLSGFPDRSLRIAALFRDASVTPESLPIWGNGPFETKFDCFQSFQLIQEFTGSHCFV
mgnify:CR=1 FL=1